MSSSLLGRASTHMRCYRSAENTESHLKNIRWAPPGSFATIRPPKDRDEAFLQPLQIVQLCAGFAPWLVAKCQRLASNNDLRIASSADAGAKVGEATTDERSSTQVHNSTTGVWTDRINSDCALLLLVRWRGSAAARRWPDRPLGLFRFQARLHSVFRPRLTDGLPVHPVLFIARHTVARASGIMPGTAGGLPVRNVSGRMGYRVGPMPGIMYPDPRVGAWPGQPSSKNVMRLARSK